MVSSYPQDVDNLFLNQQALFPICQLAFTFFIVNFKVCQALSKNHDILKLSEKETLSKKINTLNWLMVSLLANLWTFPLPFYKRIGNSKSHRQLGRKCHVDYVFTLCTFGCRSAFACILGMVPKISYAENPTAWQFSLLTNILTPIILIGLGVILPILAKKEQKKQIK